MNKTKKGIVAFLLAAALLVSMVGMASADPIGPTQWYFTEHTSGVPSGADYIAYKDSGVGTIPVTINEGVSFIWASDVACSGESFQGGNWIGWLDFTSANPLCSGETLKVEVGYLHPGGSFYSKGSLDIAGTGTNNCMEGTQQNIPVSAFTIPSGDYLAFRFSMAGGSVDIDTDTSVDSDTHIKYPYPELSTIVLFSTGLLALMGYVVYSRRNTKK